MTFNGWFQIVVFFLVILAITKPLGVYMHRVYEGEHPPLPRLLGRFERLLLRLSGVKPGETQRWQQYTAYLLAFSLFGVLVTYGLQRLQHLLPLNPQHFGAVSTHSSFNTAVSFTTNTNWQGYSGESTMSYLTQMAGLAWHNFTSAAVGLCVAVSLARGLTRRRAADGIDLLQNPQTGSEPPAMRSDGRSPSSRYAHRGGPSRCPPRPSRAAPAPPASARRCRRPRRRSRRRRRFDRSPRFPRRLRR